MTGVGAVGMTGSFDRLRTNGGAYPRDIRLLRCVAGVEPTVCVRNSYNVELQRGSCQGVVSGVWGII